MQYKGSGMKIIENILLQRIVLTILIINLAIFLLYLIWTW